MDWTGLLLHGIEGQLKAPVTPRIRVIFALVIILRGVATSADPEVSSCLPEFSRGAHLPGPRIRALEPPRRVPITSRNTLSFPQLRTLVHHYRWIVMSYLEEP